MWCRQYVKYRHTSHALGVKNTNRYVRLPLRMPSFAIIVVFRCILFQCVSCGQPSRRVVVVKLSAPCMTFSNELRVNICADEQTQPCHNSGANPFDTQLLWELSRTSALATLLLLMTANVCTLQGSTLQPVPPAVRAPRFADTPASLWLSLSLSRSAVHNIGKLMHPCFVSADHFVHVISPLIGSVFTSYMCTPTRGS